MQLRIIPIQLDDSSARRVPGLAWLALAGSTLLPAREVTVRLFWTSPPREVRLTRTGVVTRIQAGGAPMEVPPGGEIEAGGARWTLRRPVRIHTAGGRLQLTVRLPLEDYVAAVLAGEAGGVTSEEALKAMAVAARTYAARFAGRHAREGFDFCDTTHCQDLRISVEAERLRAAAEETEGELVWYRGSPAATYYAQNCGGGAEAASALWPDMKAPYLNQHTDDFCPRAEWRAEIRANDLAGAVGRPVESVAILSRTASERVARLRVGGAVVTGPAFRFAVGRALGWNLIRSDLYEVRRAGDRFVFLGRGAGHGVGLCQAGAARMSGTYRQILDFYYPGTQTGVTARGLRWQLLGGEHVEVLATDAQAARPLLDRAEHAAGEIEQETGLRFALRPRIRLYPTVATFRDATGEPGWVAASTRGRTVRLQPGAQPATLRHELLHVLLDRPGLPLWFREGLTLYLDGARRPGGRPTRPADTAFEQARTPAALQQVYDDALASVAALVKQHGRAAVLGWVERGGPP